MQLVWIEVMKTKKKLGAMDAFSAARIYGKIRKELAGMEPGMKVVMSYVKRWTI
jgi:hypothetical protein